MGYEDDRLINLTERQMLILDFLSNRRPAQRFKGCAGSGKTMLAMEKARRLASEGFDVLLTCYNAALATSLARHVPERITVMHFHGLCRELVKEAGFAIRPIKINKSFMMWSCPRCWLKLLIKPVHSSTQLS